MKEPVIVVGAGLSGLATALGAAVDGCQVTVLEAADLVGGAAAYSGGQVWVGANHVMAREGIDDDRERTERYIRGIADAQPELLDEKALDVWLTRSPEAIEYWEDIGAIRWAIIRGMIDYYSEVDGALDEGRYLTNEVIDGSRLGDWRDKLRVSPYFPVGTTYAEMMEVGRRVNTAESDNDVHGLGGAQNTSRDHDGNGDPLTFGTGVVASFLARVLDEPGIEIRTGHRVTSLIREGDGAVTGVRVQADGAEQELRGRVVLATSTYDGDAELAEEMTGLTTDDFDTLAPETVRGDGIRLVRGVGGAVDKIPATSVPMLPGWRTDGGVVGYGPEFAKPHSLIVDSHGQRFCNDSYWPDIVAKALAPEDQHLPMYLIWDEQHRQHYGLGTTPPGGEYPEGLVTSAPTLRDLAFELGIDPDGLEQTVAEFNPPAKLGKDPAFGRGTSLYVHRFYGDQKHEPSSVLGAVDQAPYYGMRLRFVGTGIGSSGIAIDHEGRVRDEQGAVIPGLYAVGAAVALTAVGTGYNSGFSLGWGLTLAYVVSRELAGADRTQHVSATR